MPSGADASQYQGSRRSRDQKLMDGNIDGTPTGGIFGGLLTTRHSCYLNVNPVWTTSTASQLGEYTFVSVPLSDCRVCLTGCQSNT